MKKLIIDIDEEHEVEYIVEEVLKLVRKGFTSGIEPSWEITNE